MALIIILLKAGLSLNLADLKKIQGMTLNKYGIVKYDAFNDVGGKLSFALAMLDKENSGFVLNAIHSREGCYTYVKEIVKGESYIVLGEEEKEETDIKKGIRFKDSFLFVGVTGFEPAASSSRTKRSTKLSHTSK